MTGLNESLEELRKQGQRLPETIIELVAVSIDDKGTLRAGWFTLEASSRGIGPGAGKRKALLGVRALAAGIGASAAGAVVAALDTTSTRTAIGDLSGAAATSAATTWFGGGAVAAEDRGMTAAPFTLTNLAYWLRLRPGNGILEIQQREPDCLDAIQNSHEDIDWREADMQKHRSMLESILPNISPAIDELAASATEAKSAKESQLASMATMRSTLTTQRAKMAEALQDATNASTKPGATTRNSGE